MILFSSHYTAIQNYVPKSRVLILPSAQCRFGLGLTCLSSHSKRHFALPHHAQTISRIYPPGGQGRHVRQIVTGSRHATTSYPPSIQALQATKLGFLFLSLPLPLLPLTPTKLDFPSLESHQQRIATHPQQSAHIFQLYRSHTLNPCHPTKVS